MFSKLRPLLFKVDPEKAHTLAIKSLKFNLIPNVFDEHKNDSIFQTKFLVKI
jgi:dihydroorotate dehydrogenase